MKLFKGTPLFSSLSAIVLLSACAGGGETGTGFVPESDVSVGVITGFGSVYVNGIKFDTGLSTFTVDGQAGSENDLKVGMLVKVSGEITDATTGRAARIEFADDAEGPVTSIANIATKQLEVMGQIVNFSADTIFESQVISVTTLDTIALGNVVEVSGYSDGSGVIYATRIEVKMGNHQDGQEIEMKGRVSALDTVAKTFQIGSLTINYSGVTPELEGKTWANNLYVEVKSLSGINQTTGELQASKIELESGGEKAVKVEQGIELELEGYISTYNATSKTFTLNGQTVQYSDSTILNSVSLADGIKLEVHGTIDQNGVLVAEEVEPRSISNTKYSGLIESVDSIAQTITMLGDRVIKINSLTSMEDDREGIDDTTRKYFHFKDLAVGQYVEVVASLEGSSLIATRVQLEDDPNASPDGSDSGSNTETRSIELEGFITQIDANSSALTVAGISINVTTPSLITGYTVGQYVEIKAEYTTASPGGTSLVLTEIRLDY